MTPFHLRDRVKKLLGFGTPAAPPAPVVAETRVPELTPVAPEPPPEPAPVVAPVVEPMVTPTPVAPGVAPAALPAEPSAADLAKQARHWQRTRKGMLKWLVEQGGEATMADMHTKSEAKYFVAHRSFSRLMEEFTAEELVTYAGGNVTLTEAGRKVVE